MTSNIFITVLLYVQWEICEDKEKNHKLLVILFLSLVATYIPQFQIHWWQIYKYYVAWTHTYMSY
jgi:hypothetical protein